MSEREKERERERKKKREVILLYRELRKVGRRKYMYKERKNQRGIDVLSKHVFPGTKG